MSSSQTQVSLRLEDSEILEERSTPTQRVGSTRQSILLSVILPAHNEAKTIRETVMRYYEEIAKEIPVEFIVAEDGSRDGTREILTTLKSELPIVVLSDDRRKGYAKAVADALRSCSGEFIFFSDSDGQYFPADFWQLWNSRDGFDLVIGRKVQRRESAYRIVLAEGFHALINALFGFDLSDADCGFRLIKRRVVHDILSDVHLLEYSFWAEFTLRACLGGFKVYEVPINHSSRLDGNSHIYRPTKIPLIVLKQLRGLLQLFSEARKSPSYGTIRRDG